MGKYLSVLLGLAAIGLGIWAARAMWPLLWAALKLLLPIILIAGGILAVLVGWAEIADTIERKRSSKSS